MRPGVAVGVGDGVLTLGGGDGELDAVTIGVGEGVMVATGAAHPLATSTAMSSALTGPP